MGGAATAVRASADQLEIVWQDSSFEGSDPADGMGLVYGAVRLDGGSLASRALSPIDRQDPRWGRAAWSGDRLGFAYAESSRAVVFGTDAVRQTLSSSGSQVQLAVIVGGWLATWNDVRNDGSPSCRELSQCATEVYAARIDDRGRVTVGATRITSDAVPAPPRPSQRDWPRLCH